MRFPNLLGLLFPPLCVNCKKNIKAGTAICGECLNGVRRNHTLFCGKCRARIPRTRRICHYDFPYTLGAACEYDSPAIRSLVHALKFRFVKDAAKPLADLLALYIEETKISAGEYFVIPLPLSQKRFRERGFNQSEAIASLFAARFDLPLEKESLLRVKNARPQSETKNLGERMQNIKGCFAVRDPKLVSGRNVILVDDVTTSGATFFEASTALKSAGAKKIIALAAAKA